MKIVVLRLGHRPGRDKRVTTHVALVARAFGADGVIISDVRDINLREKVLDIMNRFGGDFFIEMGQNWRQVLREWKENGSEIIHLTIYGLPLPEVIETIQKSKEDKLIVIGGPKVPRPIYELSDYNVSITNQPHSEIAALAVFLDYFFQGKEFEFKFRNANLEIIPDEKRKILRPRPKEDSVL
ncbi:MAG: tRNA (cytidine(56)-2'-O)-methyltransferase [Candidatus Helarchaeota archaeon]